MGIGDCGHDLTGHLQGTAAWGRQTSLTSTFHRKPLTLQAIIYVHVHVVALFPGPCYKWEPRRLLVVYNDNIPSILGFFEGGSSLASGMWRGGGCPAPFTEGTPPARGEEQVWEEGESTDSGSLWETRGIDKGNTCRSTCIHTLCTYMHIHVTY